VFAASAPFAGVRNRPIDSAAGAGWPSALLAERAPGEFCGTECGYLGNMTDFNFPTEKVGLRLDNHS
jgi:hypothetical protein